MYDLNNAQDVIKQMRDGGMVDYQIVKVLRQALDELDFEPRTDIKDKDEARQHAIDWQSWQQYHQLSFAEIAYWQTYFEVIADKFGLTDEFKENGII